MDLIRKGFWRGPTLLLAPAAVPGVDNLTLAAGMPIFIAFGVDDSRALSAPSVCKAIAAANTDCDVTLVEVSDTYELNSLVAGAGVDAATGGMRLEGLITLAAKTFNAEFLPKQSEWDSAASASIAKQVKRLRCILS